MDARILTQEFTFKCEDFEGNLREMIKAPEHEDIVNKLLDKFWSFKEEGVNMIHGKGKTCSKVSINIWLNIVLFDICQIEHNTGTGNQGMETVSAGPSSQGIPASAKSQGFSRITLECGLNSHKIYVNLQTCCFYMLIFLFASFYPLI